MAGSGEIFDLDSQKNNMDLSDNTPSDLHYINTEELYHLDVNLQGFAVDVNNSFTDVNTGSSQLVDEHQHPPVQHQASALAVMPMYTQPVHWQRYPDLESKDSNFKFEVTLPPPDNQNWMYIPAKFPDETKIFIKRKSVITFNISYRPLAPQLYLRIMVLFTSPNEMHLQVFRCANHRASSKSDIPDSHLLKCHDPGATYLGTEEGQIFGERLSVLLQLNNDTIVDDLVNSNVRLEFLCQNSCPNAINRRATTIVFTLEDQNFNIVGKRSSPVKVCSCPKRDMTHELKEPKRARAVTAPQTSSPHGKRPSKVHIPPESEIKRERLMSEESGLPTAPLLQNPIELKLVLPNEQCLRNVLQFAFNDISSQGFWCDVDQRCDLFTKYLKPIKKQLDDCDKK